jgi:hypothetical protein
MNKESYVVKKGQIISSYEFFSEGPRGKIRKVIAYQEIPGDELIFNLAFGDINEMGEIDDLAISNNSDARKILITVAKTAIEKSSKTKSKKDFSEMNFEERAAFYAESLYFKKKKEDAITFLKSHPVPKDLFKKTS